VDTAEKEDWEMKDYAQLLFTVMLIALIAVSVTATISEERGKNQHIQWHHNNSVSPCPWLAQEALEAQKQSLEGQKVLK
jgi:hypothetical protein